jgi:IclR family transcriptional regulator, KDG regulon repressor
MLSGNGSMQEQTESRYKVDAVDRAITLLQTVAAEADLGVSEIARRSGDTKARAFRLLQTLVRKGLVARSADGKGYRLGVTALVLGHAANEQIDLVRIAHPIMEEIGHDVGETLQLRICDGQESLCVAKWEPARDLRVHTMVGRRRPLYVASSKVLLAHQSDAVQEAILAAPLQRFTPNTITDARRLRARLKEIREEIRRRRYSVSRGEMNEDLISVTSAVFVAPGQIIAALNMVGPATRVEPRVEELGRRMAAAANRISIAMGYRPSTESNSPVGVKRERAKRG